MLISIITELLFGHFDVLWFARSLANCSNDDNQNVMLGGKKTKRRGQKMALRR
jgi:hypothetical protein